MPELHDAGGRHAAPGTNWSAWFDRDGLFIKPLILAVGFVAGLVAVVWRWAVNTPLLGSRLPTAAHVPLVVLFFVISVTVVSFALRRGHRALARWSQERRARPRREEA